MSEQPERCPTCGSRDKLIRLCVVENCGESHEVLSAFNETHFKVVCSDSWHSTGSQPLSAPKERKS